MQGKNYTNPEDRGRYGFSASGKFNSPYKLETFVISVTIGLAIAAAVLVVIGAFAIRRSLPTGFGDRAELMNSLIGASFLFLLVFVAGAALFIIRFTIDGFKCSYIADEEKFTADIGGTYHTIYYADVQSIHFMPRSLFGKVRGYDITVKVNGLDEEFAVTSGGYISENATPFYIIKERVELIRNDEERQRFAREAVGKGPEPKAIVPPESKDDLLDRVASLLGKDAEMPGVSAQAMPDLVAANRKPVIPDMPDIAKRVSPTVNGYADDMPAVGANGKVIGMSPIYIGSDGREHSINEVVAQGAFREVMKPQKAALIVIAAVVFYVVAAFALLSIFFGVQKMVMSVIWPAVVALLIVTPLYAGMIINVIRNGELYNYRANGREFVIISKNGKEEHILYSDVQDVVCRPVSYMLFIKGYKVEILTRYGVLRYNYVNEGIKRRLTESTLPFEVIRERISK